MRTLGLIGGVTWHSTVDYYRLINAGVQKRLGGTSSARLFLYSFEFREIEDFQKTGDWGRLNALMIDAALKLQTAGSEALVICANTMHNCVDALIPVLRIPILHIADAAAAAIKAARLQTVGLLGTRYTMEMNFYRRRLEESHGLTVLVPDLADRDRVHEVIYTELTTGLIKDSSRSDYVAVIDRLRRRGAEGVNLGCTEIPLLIRPQDVSIPVFDTTALHAAAAVDFALSD